LDVEVMKRDRHDTDRVGAGQRIRLLFGLEYWIAVVIVSARLRSRRVFRPRRGPIAAQRYF
jgi:hypothetical protein